MKRSRQRALYLYIIALISYGFINLLIPSVIKRNTDETCDEFQGQFDVWRISGLLQIIIGGLILQIAKCSNSTLHQTTLNCNTNILAVLIYIMFRSDNYNHQIIFYEAVMLFASLIVMNVVDRYFSYKINMNDKSKQRDYTQRFYQSIQKLRCYLKY